MQSRLRLECHSRLQSATCNAAPDDVSYLGTVIYIIEDVVGECSRAYVGRTMYQKAQVTYTGLNGATTTAPALNTVTDHPEITDTYTFSYNIQLYQAAVL
jgi:hypothetical protein